MIAYDHQSRDFERLTSKKSDKDHCRTLSIVTHPRLNITSLSSTHHHTWHISRCTPCIIHLREMHHHIRDLAVFLSRGSNISYHKDMISRVSS